MTNCGERVENKRWQLFPQVTCQINNGLRVHTSFLSSKLRIIGDFCEIIPNFQTVPNIKTMKPLGTLQSVENYEIT